MRRNIDIITNEELLKKFVSPSLENYFYKKLKNESPDYVKLKLCELLKFLTLSHNSFGNIPFNDEIDEMWHYWILQTVQYKELMDKLATGKFIHHSSNDYIDSIESQKKERFEEEEVNKQFSYLVSYVANFSDFSKDAVKFWPLTNNLMSALEFDLEALNHYLSKIAFDHLS